MPWLVCAEPVECRAVPNGGCVVAPGAPVWQHTTAPRIMRCARHAPVPVDEAAVDAARHELEARREALAQVNASQPDFFEPARPRTPFDARMAAAGERGR